MSRRTLPNSSLAGIAPPRGRYVDPFSSQQDAAGSSLLPPEQTLDFSTRAFSSWEPWSVFGNHASPQAFAANPQFHLTIMQKISSITISIKLRNANRVVGRRFWICSVSDSDSELRCCKWVDEKQNSKATFESRFVACDGDFEESFSLPCGRYFVLVSTSEHPGGEGVELALSTTTSTASIAPCANFLRSECSSKFSSSGHVFGRFASSVAYAVNPQFLLTVTRDRCPLLIRMACDIRSDEDALRFWIVRVTGLERGKSAAFLRMLEWNEESDCVFKSSFLRSASIVESCSLPQGNYVVVVSKVEAASTDVAVRVLACGAVAGLQALAGPQRQAEVVRLRSDCHVFGGFSQSSGYSQNPQLRLEVSPGGTTRDEKVIVRMKVSRLSSGEDDAIRFWIVRASSGILRHQLQWNEEKDVVFASSFTRTSDLSESVTLRSGVYIVVPSKHAPGDCDVTFEFTSTAELVVKLVPPPSVRRVSVLLCRRQHEFGSAASSTKFARNPQVRFRVTAAAPAGEGVARPTSSSAILGVDVAIRMSINRELEEDAIRFWIVRFQPGADETHQLDWQEGQVVFESPFRRTLSLSATATLPLGSYFVVISKFCADDCDVALELTCAVEISAAAVPPPITPSAVVTLSSDMHSFGRASGAFNFAVNPQVMFIVPEGTPRSAEKVIVRMKVSRLSSGEDDAIRFWIVRASSGILRHQLQWNEEKDVVFASSFTRTSDLSESVTLRSGVYIVVPSKHAPGDCDVTFEFTSTAELVVKLVPPPSVRGLSVQLQSRLHAFGNSVSSTQFARNPQLFIRVPGRNQAGGGSATTAADLSISLVIKSGVEVSTAIRFWIIRCSSAVPVDDHLLWWDEASDVVFSSPFLRDAAISSSLTLMSGNYRVVLATSTCQPCTAQFQIVSSFDDVTAGPVRPPSTQAQTIPFSLNASYFGNEADVQHFSHGPQACFTLRREADCEIVVQLKRSCETSGIRFFLANAVLAATPPLLRRRNGWTSNELILKSTFVESNEVVAHAKLPAGSYNVLVAASAQPLDPAATVLVTSTELVSLTPQPYIPAQYNFDSFESLIPTDPSSGRKKLLFTKHEAAEIVDRIRSQCRVNGKTFCDSSFQGDMAIGSSSQKMTRRDGTSFDLAWERFETCCDNPCVVGDRGDMYQTQQGFLGNCWLVSTFAALGMNPCLIGNLIYPKMYTQCGIYAVKLFIGGSWKAVILDDCIPVIAKTNRPAFTLSVRGNELWIPLLEKAFAKLAGCYEKLNGTISTISRADALQYLTGGVAKRELVSGPSFIPIVEHAEKMGFPMTVCTNFDKESTKNGIVGNHEYCLLGTRTHENVTLVSVYNPWGSGEWTGPWSRGSAEWARNPILVKRCRINEAVPGVSWLNVEDFRKYFGPVFTLCQVSPTIVIKDLSQQCEIALRLHHDQLVERDQNRQSGELQLILELTGCSGATVCIRSGKSVKLREGLHEIIQVPSGLTDCVMEVTLAEAPRRGTLLTLKSDCIITVSRVAHGSSSVPADGLTQSAKCGCLGASSGWHKPGCLFTDSMPRFSSQVEDDWE